MRPGVDPTLRSAGCPGRDVTRLKGEELRRLRRRMQMIFQDPFSSLDAGQSVRSILAEPLRAHDIASGKDVERRVRELLDIVGLPSEAGNDEIRLQCERAPDPDT